MSRLMMSRRGELLMNTIGDNTISSFNPYSLDWAISTVDHLLMKLLQSDNVTWWGGNGMI